MTKKSVAFHTLGCKLNFSETSYISNQFNLNNYIEVKPNDTADIHIINTCSVTAQTNKKCRELIRKIIRNNPKSLIVATGCYAQLKPEDILRIDGVDLVLGNIEKFDILNKIEQYIENKVTKKNIAQILDDKTFYPAYSINGRTRSFLKIQDGCDNYCAYCTIPLARGHSRSGFVKDIMNQIAEIAKFNIKEIIITGVNIGDFGKHNNEKLIDLMFEIEKLESIKRFRLSSIEPELLSNEMIDIIANSKNILPHFHIPLQSGNDFILNKMKRKYDLALFSNLINNIRKKMPHAFIGVDVILGFPGETDILFNETLNYLKQLDISEFHSFTYSERENTLATDMDNSIPFEIRKERSKMVQNLSKEKLLNFYKNNIGKTFNVLFEQDKKGDFIYGYTDNYIKVKTLYDKNLVNNVFKVTLTDLDNENNVLIKF